MIRLEMMEDGSKDEMMVHVKYCPDPDNLPRWTPSLYIPSCSRRWPASNPNVVVGHGESQVIYEDVVDQPQTSSSTQTPLASSWTDNEPDMGILRR